MFGRSRRRTRAPFVFYLAAGFAGVGTGELIGWLLVADRRAQHPPVAVMAGMVLGSVAILILVGLLLLRSRRSAS